MANKHNDYYLRKTAQNGNNAPKMQKKKKLTYYFVIFAIIFCFLGSILGSWAFIENKTSSASIDPINTTLSFEHTEVDSNYQYNLNTGVSTNIGLTDYTNIGWAGWTNSLGRIYIFNAPRDDSNYQVPFIQFTPFSNTIIPFVSFNGNAALQPYTSYVITLQLGISNTAVNNLNDFSFYFLGGEQINITEKIKNTPIEVIDNTPIRTVKFVVSNLTANYLTYSSYRFNINFNNISSYNLVRFHTINIQIADYSIGYENGYNQGNADGYQNGFNNGYNEGEVDGYQDGLSKNNSFYSLFSAMFDVPIKAFYSLFNFDIFGQNLANFFLAILTFAVVIKIVQLLL